jgi:phage tail sheath protein FI
MATYSWPGVYVEEVPSAIKPIAGVGTSTAAFIGVSADITGAWDASNNAGMPANASGEVYTQAAALTPVALNSWTDFTQAFGDIQTGNQYLAQAVLGFFNNGGTRCWVARVSDAGDDLTEALEKLESIDEVAIVAAPLPPETTPQALNAAQEALVTHCNKLQDRFAILDSSRDIANSNLNITTDATGIWRPAADPKGYAAFYFPWILVSDPLGVAGTQIAVPPSGHVAGIYARSDAERGVQKAPANEVISGALDVEYAVSKIAQGPLNLAGVNCIRSFGGTIKVYGARTLASDPAGDPEWIYVNVRRLINFLRESIDEGTQWAVFEPNADDLWSKIRRNVSSFLNSEWAAGALVGATPDQAFYVRCDETTNPPDVQALGQVVTEIGVAPTKPAEFVIFRLSQWAGSGS